MRSFLVMCLLFLFLCESLSQRTFLDNFTSSWRSIRRFLANSSSRSKQSNLSNFRKSKLQTRKPKSFIFPCDVYNARSAQKPDSVHKLKPGDIDIIAGIGDSLTAGTGITATNFFELFEEERGKSFSMGGQGDWKQFTTLPNILKVFNPNLRGYASQSAISVDKESEFNVAEPSAISSDMPYMAKELIKRMKYNNKVDINNDWKMITIFIGANDFCGHLCYLEKPETSLEKHKNDMIQLLRILRDNLPRTIINFIPLPNLESFVELKVLNNPSYEFFRLFECPCFFGLPNQNKKQLLYNIIREWQKVDLQVCNLEEFDKNDFTVVIQPFSVNYTFPTIAPGIIDDSFLSGDCFHWSQKGHARVANDLWNNIMEPVGKKSLNGNKLFSKFLCPTQEYPYIFTRRNS